MTASPDPETQAAVRTVWLAVAALLALVVGSIVVLVARSTDSGDQGSVQTVDAAQAAGGPAAIGPPLRADIVAYVAARQAVLRDLRDDSQDRIAVVSFVSYRSAADASAVLDETPGHTGIDVLGRLVAVPGDAPALVEGDLDGWLGDRRTVLQRERDEIAGLLATVGSDRQFRAFYERELARLDRALGAVGAQGDIVFGLLVRGSIPALQALGERAPVRLVDVGPNAPLGPDDGYRGLLPDDTTTVSDPQLRP